MGIEISLESYEIIQASIIGIMRQTKSIQNKAKNTYKLNDGNDWQIHIEGALGELAVAKCLNMFWTGGVDNHDKPDVGEYEIRTASKHNYRLILHDKDKDDAIFIFVTGLNGEYIVQGWIRCKDGKNKKYWNDPKGNRPAYFIPKEDLKPISELKNVEVKK